jgi:predicted aspartyl protease
MFTRRIFLTQAAAAIASPAAAAGARNLIVRHDRLFLNVRLNGHPVRGLVDSAAEASFVDTVYAGKIGLSGGAAVQARGSGGDTQARMADGVTIEALGLRLGPLSVALLDLSDIGRRLLRGPLDLVVGRELFDAARLSIDIAGGRMAVASPGEDPAGVRLGLTTVNGIETFEASVEGHPEVQAAFDLGNGGPVLVGLDYARELGLLTDGRPIRGVLGGGIGGEKALATLRLRSLSLAGREFTNVPAVIDTTGSATKLNIGVPQLRHYRIVTDFPAKKLWLARA